MKAPEITIYAQVSLKHELFDNRPRTFGLKFGTIEDVCKQFGVKYVQLPTCIAFSAPKTRLQLFVEKLHFSRIIYSSSII